MVLQPIHPQPSNQQNEYMNRYQGILPGLTKIIFYILYGEKVSFASVLALFEVSIMVPSALLTFSEAFLIANITIAELDTLRITTSKLFYPLQALFRGIIKIVDNNDIVRLVTIIATR